MPMTEDLSVFFDPAEFAESVVVGAVTCNAIFDQAAQVLVGEVIVTAPTLTLPAASVPAVAEGTPCTVRAQAYRVRQVLPQAPDGAIVLLVLARG